LISIHADATAKRTCWSSNVAHLVPAGRAGGAAGAGGVVADVTDVVELLLDALELADDALELALAGVAEVADGPAAAGA
jgi:hypothetical protein